jgi:hypothetical protein
MSDDRTYFFTEKNGRYTLFIITPLHTDGYVFMGGEWSSREKAIARRGLEGATEIPVPASFKVRPKAKPVHLPTFSRMVSQFM